jgi:DOPA 4,5-dioxygenase
MIIAPYKSPLSVYEADKLEPLPSEANADGKSLYNPPGPLSSAYDKFAEPIRQNDNGLDFHSM